ncbi:MAG TPA: GNAT family N-acetyltransferase, partial [Sorangium sp.]|nr:GNAT family N-acetyltransferase [Sorangium sp.]
HAADIIALIEPIFGEYQGVIFDVAEMPELHHIASHFAAAGGAFWCALCGPAVVGCVGWVRSANGVELRKLYVARSQRRAGLGTRLLARVERAAAARGAALVELWSDVKFAAAHRFYQHHGYRRGPQQRALNDRSHTVEYYFCKRL